MTVLFPSVPGLGENTTEQEPAVRTQLLLTKVPEELEVKPTVPVGAIAVPPPLSATVALQVVGELTGTELGVQATDAVAARGVTETLKFPTLPV